MPTSRDPAPFTGDMLADYDSGALAGHALGRWSGCCIEIFLLPDDRVVLVCNESTFNYVRTWTLEDVIAGKADIVFDTSQQEASESFYQCVNDRARAR